MLSVWKKARFQTKTRNNNYPVFLLFLLGRSPPGRAGQGERGAPQRAWSWPTHWAWPGQGEAALLHGLPHGGLQVAFNFEIMGLHWKNLWKSNCRFCSISGYGAPHQVKTCQITWLLWQFYFYFCCACNSLVPKISSCHCLLWDISNPAKKWVFYFTGWRHWPCSGGILHHSTQRWRLPWTEIHHARQR